MPGRFFVEVVDETKEDAVRYELQPCQASSTLHRQQGAPPGERRYTRSSHQLRGHFRTGYPSFMCRRHLVCCVPLNPLIAFFVASLPSV